MRWRPRRNAVEDRWIEDRAAAVFGGPKKPTAMRRYSLDASEAPVLERRPRRIEARDREAEAFHLTYAAEDAFERGDLDLAEELDARAAEAVERAFAEEGDDDDAAGHHYEPGVEEQFSRVWAGWLQYLEGWGPFHFPGGLPEVAQHLRSVAQFRGLRDDVTDAQLLAAARDAFEARQERVHRFRGMRSPRGA